MLKIGEFNKLEAIRSTHDGMFLKGESADEVFIHNDELPEKFDIGDEVVVFLYNGADGDLAATTLRPFIALDSFACLEVVSVNRIGAFFDMGLDKDLLVPHREQNVEVEEGDWRIVHMYLDEQSQRLTGSMMWREYCFKEDHSYEVNQKVKIMIGERTTLGRNVLIDNAFYGLIYNNEIFEELVIGDIREAYIKNIREDGDIDVSLQKLGYSRVLSSSDKILELLQANDGVLEIGDKSSPEKIAALTGMSKKTFKKAIGDLYRKKQVLLEKEKVRLV